MSTLRNKLKVEQAQLPPQVVSPFDGDPPTQVVTDEHGNVLMVSVRPHVLTPCRAKVADFLGGLTTLLVLVLGLGLVALSDQPGPYMWPIALLAPWPFMCLIRKVYRHKLRKRTAMIFTEDKFSVGRVRGKPAIYDRHEIGCFRVKIHDKAQNEEEQHEMIEAKARMRGQVIREKKYYRDSFKVRLIYSGYPHDVIEIMGEKDAELVLARLQAVNQFMDQVMAMGRVVAKGPQSEWDDLAGKIPEKV